MNQKTQDLLLILQSSLYSALEVEDKDQLLKQSSLHIAKQIWEAMDENQRLGYFSQALVYIIYAISNHKDFNNDQIEALIDICLDLRYRGINKETVRDYGRTLRINNINLSGNYDSGT